jgi:RNA polymerase sigma-70 factor (ECF subfamily)
MSDFLDGIEGHIPALRRYARALTGNADMADDLVQDCLERAIRKQALWVRGSNLRAWLYTMLLNLFRNARRRASKARFDALETMPVDPAQAPAQPGRLALAEVSRAIARLPDEQREALLLVVLEGQSYAEAAGILAIPVGTLMSRIGRARANLRTMTGEAGEPRLRAVK